MLWPFLVKKDLSFSVISDIVPRESILGLFRWIPATNRGYDRRGEGSLPKTRRDDKITVKMPTYNGGHDD
jgi:hypothetical protein